MHYASFLKFGCAEFLNWNGEKDEPGRTLLQVVGTNHMRRKYPDFWVEGACKWINAVLHNYYDIFIIADARFVNEIEYIKIFPFDFNVDILPTRITRREYNTTLTAEQQAHPSETSLDSYWFNYGMFTTNLEDLEQEVQQMVSWMKEAKLI